MLDFDAFEIFSMQLIGIMTELYHSKNFHFEMEDGKRFK